MSASGSSVLYTLGRRVERLLLLGVVLVVASLTECYFITAARQLNEDRTISAVSALLEALTSQQATLASLYREPKAIVPPPVRVQQPIDQAERAARIARRRARPDSQDQKDADIEEPAAQRTYESHIDEIVRGAASASGTSYSSLARFADPTKAPTQLIAELSKERERLDKNPTAVWGIETQRLFLFQYAGMDYKIPLSVIATVLGAAISLLIPGWLGTLYATRQRELVVIAGLEDYKLAFPHVLNFLPVRIGMLERASRPAHRTRRPWEGTLNRVISGAIRTVVVLVFSLTMLYGYVYTIVQFWELNAQQRSLAIYLAVITAFFILCQLAMLVAQEWILLHRKEFAEG